MKRLIESICNEIATDRGKDKQYSIVVLYNIGINLDSLDNFEYLAGSTEDFMNNYEKDFKDIASKFELTPDVVQSLYENECDFMDVIYQHDLSKNVGFIEVCDENKLRSLVKKLVFNNVSTCVITSVRDEQGIGYEFKVMDCRYASDRFIDSEQFLRIKPFYGQVDDPSTVKTACIGSRYVQNILVPEDIKYVIDKVVKEKDYESAATCLTGVTCDIITAKATESIKKYVRSELGDLAGDICDKLLNFNK